MDAVLLDGAGDVNHVFVDHGHKGCVVLSCDGAEELVKGLNIVRAVVGGQGDAGEQNPDVSGLKRGDYLVKIAAGLIERHAAQSVIAAELDDDDFRVKAQEKGKAGDGVLGGGAAGPLVDDFIVVSLGVKQALQGVGEGLAVLEAITGCDAVSEADQDVRSGGCER